MASINPAMRKEFLQRLRISLSHHDAAPEGDVLSYSEIKAAIDPTIISDPSLIPAYDEIKRFNEACDVAQDLAATCVTAITCTTARVAPVTAETPRATLHSMHRGSAGLDAAYVRRQFSYFRDGVRGTDPKDVPGRQMAMMSRTLPADRDLDDVIAFIHQQGRPK